MGNLYGLGVDILFIIMKQLYDDGAFNLKPLNRVSRNFYAISMPLLYRSIRISVFSAASICLLKRLNKEDSFVHRFIREINVLSSHDDDFDRGNEIVFWNLFANVIPRLKCLDTFYWRYEQEMPLQIVQSLEQLGSQVRLYVCHWGQWDRDNDQNVLEDSVALYHLDIIPERDRSNSMKSNLWTLLRSCPNLRSLFVRSQADQFASLTWEYSRGHRIDTKPSTKSSVGGTMAKLTSFSVLNRTLGKKNFVKWSKLGGWTSLERVSVRNFRYLQHIRGCEATLRCLSLCKQYWPCAESLSGYMARLQGLEELSVVGRRLELPIEGLKHCQNSLRSLRFYETRGTRNGITLASLTELQLLCPNLRCLHLDFVQDGRQRYDFLKILTQFSALETLVLNCYQKEESSVGDARNLESMDRKFDESTATRFFKFILNQESEQILQEIVLLNAKNVNYSPSTSTTSFFSSSGYRCKITINPVEKSLKANVERMNWESVCKTLSPNLTKSPRKRFFSKLYWQDMPPAILKSEAKKCYGLCGGTSAVIQPELRQYEIRVQNEKNLDAYEAVWKEEHGASTSTYPDGGHNMWIEYCLEYEFSRRRTHGWDIPQPATRGFLYDELYK